MEKYQDSSYQLDEKVLKTRFPKGSFIFLQDMSDIFPKSFWGGHSRIIDELIRPNLDSKFLWLTKNPYWYVYYVKMAGEEFFPNNCVLGATIESNVNYPEYSKAPSQQERLYWMRRLSEEAPNHDLFISIEPILDFRLEEFVLEVANVHPWAVALGYDNYKNNLFEPTLEKTLQLVGELKKFTKVYTKTIRKAWNE